MVLAVVRATAGDGIRAGVAVQGLFDAITILLAAWVAGRLFGRRAAVLAFMFTLLWPPFLRESRFLQTEPMFTCALAVVATLCVRLARSRSTALALWLGATGAVAALVRPNGVIPLAVLALGAGIAVPRLRQHPRMLVALALAFLCVLAPWTARNWHVFHRLVPVSSGGGELFFMGTNTETDGRWDHVEWKRLRLHVLADASARAGHPLDALEADHALLSAGLANWSRDPAYQLGLWLKRAGRLVFVPLGQERGVLRLLFLLTILAVHALAVTGAVRAARTRTPEGRLALVLLATVLVSACTSTLFYCNSRYFEPLRWFELVLAAGILVSSAPPLGIFHSRDAHRIR